MNPVSCQTLFSQRCVIDSVPDIVLRHSSRSLLLLLRCIHSYYIGLFSWRSVDQVHSWKCILFFCFFFSSFFLRSFFYCHCKSSHSSWWVQCGLMECLNNMLLKWLTWHSVYALEDDLDISLNSHTSMWVSQQHTRRTLTNTANKMTHCNVCKRMICCQPLSAVSNWSQCCRSGFQNVWRKQSLPAGCHFNQYFMNGVGKSLFVYQKKFPHQICTICSPPTTKTMKVELNGMLIFPLVFS